VRRLFLLTAVGAALVALAAPAPAGAQLACDGGALPGDPPTPKVARSQLLFGIFPGGAAGVIAGPRPPATPEDQGKIDAALATLRDGHPFVAHLFTEFTGDRGVDDAAIALAEATTDHYERRGLLVEWVVRYRPHAAPDVAAYARFIGEVVSRLGTRHATVGLQVTNEVNNSLSPDASDGAYAGARDAIIEGVVAAKERATSLGLAHMRIGFNWFYRMDPSTEEGFWSYLAQHGGQRFAAAVDWVGLDAYPGTFFPPAGAEVNGRDAMINALSVLRGCFMPTAGLRSRVAIHVSENGWPTAPPARGYAAQEQVLRAMIGAVNDYRGNYGISDYLWFDLRDSISDDPRFEQQYGITRDDYTPKPAFAAYRELIGRFGVAASSGSQPGTAPARHSAGLVSPSACVPLGRRFRLSVRAGLVRAFTRRHPRARLSRVDFFVDGVRRAIRRRTPFSATIDTAGLRPGRHRARVRIYLRRRVSRRMIVITRTLSARFSVC
jgi:hypothetical protein